MAQQPGQEQQQLENGDSPASTSAVPQQPAYCTYRYNTQLLDKPREHESVVQAVAKQDARKQSGKTPVGLAACVEAFLQVRWVWG